MLGSASSAVCVGLEHRDGTPVNAYGVDDCKLLQGPMDAKSAAVGGRARVIHHDCIGQAAWKTSTDLPNELLGDIPTCRMSQWRCSLCCGRRSSAAGI